MIAQRSQEALQVLGGSQRSTETPPTVGIIRPREQATYLLNQAVTAAYGCVDRGVGVASCEGSAVAGGPVATAAIGAATFAVTGTDLAGNASPASVSYTVTYAIVEVDNEPGRGSRDRSRPVALRIADGAGVNRSSPETPLFARGILAADGTRVNLAGTFRIRRGPARIRLHGRHERVGRQPIHAVVRGQW